MAFSFSSTSLFLHHSEFIGHRSRIFSSRLHRQDYISTISTQRRPSFLLRESRELRHGVLRQFPHGSCNRKSSTHAVSRLVSFLRASLHGRCPLPGPEGLPAGLVSQPAGGIVDFRASRVFARRRAVVAPCECAETVLLRKRGGTGAVHVRARGFDD